jgi:hypothetical protein
LPRVGIEPPPTGVLALIVTRGQEPLR